jgi:wyosine [tRNA(Phe)-imidazoG37] synthetase (radical SAM superfamily)
LEDRLKPELRTVSARASGQNENCWGIAPRIALQCASSHPDAFPAMLAVTDHSRDSAGLTYVYPVLSRRSGGLSVGVNLNPNNACNWRCLYCQVPNLTRGGAPEIDLDMLERELRGFLARALNGEFFREIGAPAQDWPIRDIALSGNGEPTSAPAFERVVEIVGQVASEHFPEGGVKRVLISNGSLVQRENVQRGLARWGETGGEMWFKLDSALAEGIRRINQVESSPASVARRLETAARLCPVWLQTCLFAWDGQPPSDAERQAYLAFLADALARGIPLRGVLLYGLARPSLQVEAPRLSALPAAWMEEFAEEVRGLGLETRLSL